MHVRKISSRDILDPYLAKESIRESRNQAKILHDSESRQGKLIVAGPLVIISNGKTMSIALPEYIKIQ